MSEKPEVIDIANIPEEIIEALSAEEAEVFGVVPVGKEEGILTVAAGPVGLDPDSHDELALLADCNGIRVVEIMEEDLAWALMHYYSFSRKEAQDAARGLHRG